MSDLGEWAEMHGYTQKCGGCGQTTDSKYCSVRCELDAHREKSEDGEDEGDGDTITCDVVPYGDENNEPNQSHGDAKHERDLWLAGLNGGER